MDRKITRLYTGEDGETHFEDISIPLEDRGNRGWLSKPIKVKEIMFRVTGGDFDLDWHNAPQRQFVIILDGESEIEIGDGTKRRFVGGDILLAEDTKGRGHITRALNNQSRRSIFVVLD